MNLVVCVKQVPDTTDIKIDQRTGNLIREGVPCILNPYDQFAVEEAVRIRDEIGQGRVAVISMGPQQARSVLMKCLAMGADAAVLISDKKFVGSDTWATSYTLSLAIKKLGAFDIVLCGQQAIDGDTGQVGPELSQQLGIPQVTYVEKIDIDANRLRIHKQTGEGYNILEAKVPLLLALVPPTSFQPGYPSISGILRAKKKPLNVWEAVTLGGDESMFGLEGSFTQVLRTYTPPPRGKCVILEGNDSAKSLAEILLRHDALSER